MFARVNYLTPSIVIIEFNPKIPPDVNDCDSEGTVFLRHSAKAVQAAKSDRVVACAGPNAILVSEVTIAKNPGAGMPNDWLLNVNGDDVVTCRLATEIKVLFPSGVPGAGLDWLGAATKAISYVRSVWGKAVAVLRYHLSAYSPARQEV